jgi:predicted aspartyl protease
MAVNPGVTSSRFPYLPIRLQIRQHTYEGDALIDTGFDGGIAVPLSLLEDVGPPDSHELWAPVVGPSVTAPVYRGSFQVGDLGPFPIAVTALGDEILVGLEVISRFAVTFDHGQRVIINS